MPRIPTSGRKRSDDPDDEFDGQENEKEKKTPFRELAQLRFAEQLLASSQVEKVDRLPSDEEGRRKVLRSLAILRSAGMTYVKCAAHFGVSENTITNWLKDPLYKEEQQALPEDARADGFVTAAALAPKALGVLNLLMTQANSDFVKMQSAIYLLKVAGLEIPRESGPTDDKRGVAQYLENIRQRSAGANINLQVTINDKRNAEQEPAAPVVDALPSGDTSLLPGDVFDQLEQIGLRRQQEEMLEEYNQPMLPGGKLPGNGDEGRKRR